MPTDRIEVAAPAPPRAARRPPLGPALAAGLLAGLVAWGAGEAAHARFRRAPTASGGIPSPEQVRADTARRDAATRGEAASALGALGAALGLALGAAGGLSRRSGRSARDAAGAGLILGGLAGAAAPLAVLPIYFRLYQPTGDELPLAVMTHAAIHAAIGAAAGAALGLGLGGRAAIARPLVGGLLGAAAGGVAFDLIGALAFPADETTGPIAATATTRLLARGLVALGAAAGAAAGAAPHGPARGPDAA